MNNIAAVILSAGKGKRMKSGLAKVLHPVVGRPMAAWSVDAARASGAADILLVTGHQSEAVSEYFKSSGDLRTIVQEELLGTGHAVACALKALDGFNGTILILCGDTPLLRSETLVRLTEFHRSGNAVITMLTAEVGNSESYGRVVRDHNGELLRIVEQKDATPDEQAIREINSGIYCMASDFLFANIGKLGNSNAQREYYLTDLLEIAVSNGMKCLAMQTDDPDEILGINDRVQLAEACQIMRRRINRDLMLSGVTMVAPEQTYINYGVAIGPDTVIHHNCQITGSTVIGGGCIIETGVSISDCRIGNDCHIKAGSVLEGAELHEEVSVGPMAHLRPGTVLHKHVKIGNFVETKKAVLGQGSKASHLTYLGDTEIGRDVNIGCGTITCNYDGVKKHRTIIGDGVFIGSDVQLVAPVTVGSNSLVAAGTTVTVDVPPDSLAIARVPQVNKEGWRLRKK